MKTLMGWLTISVFLVGCASTSAGSSLCEAGASQACTCESDRPGAQSCATDGSQWNDCECTSADVGSDADAGQDTTTPPINTGLIESWSVEANPNSTLSALVTATTMEPARVSVLFSRPGQEPTQTGQTPAGTDHAITVVGMRAETGYELILVAETADPVQEGGSVSTLFTTGALPSAMPEYSVTVHDANKVQPGTTLFGVGRMGDDIDTTTPLYLGVDEEGEVVWYYQDTTAKNNHMDREARLLSDGNIQINLQGEFRIIDLAGNTVASFKGGPNVGGPVHHDAAVLPNGNALILANEIVSADVPELGGAVDLKADRIVEMTPDGTVVWEWHAADHLDTTRFPGALSKKKGKQSTAYDWSHANALFYNDGDDSMLVSVRHQNWVVNISHATGEVLWSLGDGGDFALEGIGSLWFYSQHDPRWLTDGTLLVYDNGNERPDTATPYSRAARYTVNVETMTAKEIWSYTTETYTNFLGGAKLLPNGNVLVCAGGIQGKKEPGSPPGPAPPGDGTIIEVTGDQPAEKIWELTAKGALYRATRLQSFWIEEE